MMSEEELKKMLYVSGIFNIIKYLNYPHPVNCSNVAGTNFKLKLDRDYDSEFFRIFKFDFGEYNEEEIWPAEIPIHILQAIYTKLYERAYEEYRRKLNIDKMTRKGLEDLGIWQHLIRL